MRGSFKSISVAVLLAASIVDVGGLGGAGGRAFGQPLTTVFTYQGELQSGGAPATGLHDLRFSLFDGAAGGAQVGGTLCIDNVDVSAGRFAVPLDFGAVFAGQQRFLEIEVRADTGVDCTNTTGFTMMTPRQPLTAAPNALFALNATTATTAAMAATATNATQLNGQAASFYRNAANLNAGNLPSARLGGTYSGALTFSNAANSFTGLYGGNGSALTGLNATNLASGTVADARLSGNVALLGGTQTFGGVNSFSNAGNLFTGGGAGLTGLNAGSLSTGTVANARTTGTPLNTASTLVLRDAGGNFAAGTITGAFSGSGAALTALNASNIASGALADARLSGNVALLNNAQTFTGAKTFSNVGNLFTGGGAGLTGLNAGSLATGTVANARTTGTALNTASTLVLRDAGGNFAAGTITGAFSGSGAALTALNAANITAGALADARLSGNVALLNNAQTFTAAKTFSAAPAFTAPGSPFSLTSTALVTNLNADLLDGLNSSAFLQSIPVPLTLSGTSATYIIGGVNASTFGGARGVYGVSTAATGFTYGASFDNSSTSGTGVFGRATASSGTTYGVYGQSNSTAGTGVTGSATAASGVAIGVVGRSDSTSGAGVSGSATAATGVTFGGNFQSDSTSGLGVYSLATAATGATYGVYGQSASTDGRGVYGVGSATSGSSYGVYGLSASSPGGRGVVGEATGTFGVTYGGYFQSASTDGRGVRGEGRTYGVGGFSDGTFGHAVSGFANALTGDTFGGHFRSNSTSGRGVYGEASATTGSAYGVYGRSNSTSGRGVWGFAAAGIGTIYGVYGSAVSAGGYAVFADGDMGATGVKPFRIDHPDDPENKYLLHYAAESPEVINFYSGKATLDGTGGAVVELPHYFAKINKDPRYTLTAIGAPMPMLHVAEEIDETALSAGGTAEPGEAAPLCSFRIAGGMPGAKVSWRVEAIRNDRWVQQRGAPVEVDKQDLEKGTYQHPELYGQPPEKGMNYDAERGAPVERAASDEIVAPTNP